MRIDQRNNGASVPINIATAYTIDRWRTIATTNTGNLGKNLNAINSTAIGFPYYLGFQTSTVAAGGGSDRYVIFQPIEADFISDYCSRWDAPNAQPITISFFAYSSLSGTFSGGDPERQYVKVVSVRVFYSSRKHLDEGVQLLFQGILVVTWSLSGNNSGMFLYFDLGCGTTFRGPAGIWSGPVLYGATGAVSVVGTNGATFYVTWRQAVFEIGSVATALQSAVADWQEHGRLPEVLFRQ